MVEENKLYLFRIYSKDFSPASKGKPNLHTLYWKALFDENNLNDIVYELNGEAEMFFRKASIEENNKKIHKAGERLKCKNSTLSGQMRVFNYDIIKDRRFTVDKYQLHVPVTMNFKADNKAKINEKVLKYIKNNPDINILGIDRGERNLLYISLIDRNGNVVKNADGKFIQYDLNHITGFYNDSSGKAIPFKTPYHTLLEEREKTRETNRKNWDSIASIKELKDGYLSQAVYQIIRLAVEYNAIIVMEDLNSGFKNRRVKFEKQVYQKFEKALTEKLQYLVFKDKRPDEPGGLYKALQLASEYVENAKQNGFIFYVPAWNTSKIDPVTGFVDLLKPKFTTVAEAKAFFGKFRRISYNVEGDWFEFDFRYSDFDSRFTEKEEDKDINEWTVCTYGKERYVYDRSSNGGRDGNEIWDVTENLKALFREANIVFAEGGSIKEAIISQSSAEFFKGLIKNLKVTLAMRYSSREDCRDFILSPVAKNGKFFFSEDKTNEPSLPRDADANGAYNIARKGLWLLRQIDGMEEYGELKRINDIEWLRFARALSK